MGFLKIAVVKTSKCVEDHSCDNEDNKNAIILIALAIAAGLLEIVEETDLVRKVFKH